jgi:hypothetical protein
MRKRSWANNQRAGLNSGECNVPPTDISKIKLLHLPRSTLFPLGRRTSVPDIVPAQSGPRWYQFSLRSLLAAMLVVAAFLAGRASVTYRDALAPPLEGDWLIEFPGGARRMVAIRNVGPGRFSLASGGNLAGIYEWRSGQLVVVQPADKRFVGLTWQWVGQRLILVAEPPNTPAGSSYTGTNLTRAPARK